METCAVIRVNCIRTLSGLPWKQKTYKNRKIIENFCKESIFWWNYRPSYAVLLKMVILSHIQFSNILHNILENLLHETLWLRLELLLNSVTKSLLQRNLILYRNQSTYLHCQLVDCKLTGRYIFLFKDISEQTFYTIKEIKVEFCSNG